MTTPTAGSAPQTIKTLSARRRRAEADLEAVDAQQRAREAAAAAAAAEQQAAQALQAEQEAARQQALQRMAELRARLDALDPPKQQEQQPTYAEFCAARDRWEECDRELAELEAYKPPPPRMTREEQAELQAELDAAVAASEHEGEGLFYHAGRLWDRSRFY